MKDPRAWMRPHLRECMPYTTARDLYQEGLFLDANENPYGTLAPEYGDDLNRYPDPQVGDLRAALAAWLEVEPERLWIGNGGDEALELLHRAFVDPGESVVVCTPTYGMYAITARAHGAQVREAPLDGAFDLDVSRTLGEARGAKIIFLCTPNNPTGNVLDPERVERLAEGFDGLVVADEAYVEFSDGRSLIRAVPGHRNLVVLRTFSKVWGLAGARVGYFLADPEVVQILDRVNLPYPLSRASARAACLALARPDRMAEWRLKIVAERARLSRKLSELGFHVFPSQANFVLVRVPNARAAYRRLASEFGVVVRDRSDVPRLEDCLRISVGKPEDSDRVCQALEAMGAR
ncbi:MAG: histidinol-phosphate transaminase [Gemmatimonadetes bacterium]|nr:histidinol-phosphate transaminase [Gemmatimonadota bacterium]